jgi:hypothetical protein
VASGQTGSAPQAPSAAFAAFPVAQGAEIGGGGGAQPQKFNLSPETSPVLKPRLPEPVVASLSMAADGEKDDEKPELCD